MYEVLFGIFVIQPGDVPAGQLSLSYKQGLAKPVSQLRRKGNTNGGFDVDFSMFGFMLNLVNYVVTIDATAYWSVRHTSESQQTAWIPL